MFRSLGRVLRFVGYPLKVTCRRPRLTLLVGLLLLTGAIVGVRQYALAQWQRAQADLKADRPKEARDRLAFCLRVWPRSPEVHRLAARAARLVNDFNGAEAHLNRCLELEQGATDAVRLEFLLLRTQAGEVDELAPVLFDTVEKGHPESPLILETVARAYMLRLRYKPASACLSKWIEIEPQNAKPFHWRGWALERLNNRKGARADYNRALELDPDLVPVRLRVAEMFIEDKQAPEALPHLERLFRQVPDNPHVQAQMGICLFLLGRGVEARRLMEGAVDHLPNDPALLVALANLDLQDGRPAEAERRLRAVLAADSSDTESLFVLASALQLQGRAEESAATLAEYTRKRVVVERINELLKDKADNPTAKADDYAEIGRLFLEIGRNKYGVYWLEQALERDPSYQPAHSALAEYYERKGDATAAAVHRKKLRSPEPVKTPDPPKSENNTGGPRP
jgi:tetratricopeptide (TPR) repeat protein